MSKSKSLHSQRTTISGYKLSLNQLESAGEFNVRPDISNYSLEDALNNDADLQGIYASMVEYGFDGTLEVTTFGRTDDLYTVVHGNGRLFLITADHYGEKKIKGLSYDEAGNPVIPCILKKFKSRAEMTAYMGMKNNQRRNTIYEHGKTYQALIELGNTKADIGRKMGVSPTNVARRLDFINYPRLVKMFVNNEIQSSGAEIFHEALRAVNKAAVAAGEAALTNDAFLDEVIAAGPHPTKGINKQGVERARRIMIETFKEETAPRQKKEKVEEDSQPQSNSTATNWKTETVQWLDTMHKEAVMQNPIVAALLMELGKSVGNGDKPSETVAKLCTLLTPSQPAKEKTQIGFK